jgi:hypothetical protein
MALPDAPVAAREAAAPVAMVQGAPERGRNRARPGADLHHLPVRIMSHHHAAGIARQAPRRFRGNVAGLFQHGLAGLRGVGQRRGVHVDHHLIPLARGAGIERVMQRRLGEQG